MRLRMGGLRKTFVSVAVPSVAASGLHAASKADFAESLLRTAVATERFGAQSRIDVGVLERAL